MELFRQLVIVFNDAVMDEGNFSGTMRMSIGIGNAAVGSPSGMANAAVGSSVDICRTVFS